MHCGLDGKLYHLGHNSKSIVIARIPEIMRSIIECQHFAGELSLLIKHTRDFYEWIKEAKPQATREAIMKSRLADNPTQRPLYELIKKHVAGKPRIQSRL